MLLGQNVNSYWDETTLSSKEWVRLRDANTHRSGVDGEGVEGIPYKYAVAPGFTQRQRVLSRGAQNALSAKAEGGEKVKTEGDSFIHSFYLDLFPPTHLLSHLHHSPSSLTHNAMTSQVELTRQLKRQ